MEEQRHISRQQLGLAPMAGAPQHPALRGTLTPGGGPPSGASGGVHPHLSEVHTHEASTSGQGSGVHASSYLASFERPSPLAWTPPVTKELSLALSVLGLGLQVWGRVYG